MPPLRVGHRLSRPIPGVLTEVGQRIEYRGLAHVGIPRQGDDPILRAASVDDQSGVGSPRAGGGMCKAHQASTARPTAWGTFSRSSATQRASCSRNAMTAPANQIGRRVPGGAVSLACHPGPRDEPDVQQPAAHGRLRVHPAHKGALPVQKRVHRKLFKHIWQLQS